MRCDALDSRLGTEQGRIAPSDWQGASGNVFALGSSEARTARLRLGDFVQVEQLAARPVGATLLRLRSRLVTHDDGNVWLASLIVAGTVVATRTLERSRDAVDLVANLAEITAGLTDFVIAFRLELVDLAGTAELTDAVIPAWYVDDLFFEASDAITIGNRSPEPNEAGVPVDTTIGLDVFDPTQSAFAVAKIFVVDVLACSGGTFGNGFTGTWIETNGTIRVTIDPPVDFDPLADVSVRVEVLRDNGEQNATVFAYTFRTEDTIAPRILEAVAVSRRTVRVTFDETITGGDDPAAWFFSVASTSIDDGLPAVPLTVASVAAVASHVFDVSTVDDMTPGALYRILAAGIVDASGNVVAAPHNAFVFSGFRPVVPAGRSFDLLSMLPDLNVGEDVTGDLRKFVACLQEPTDLMLADIDAWTEILDPDTAPEAFVDAMLADLGNPFDAFELELIDKRRLARLLVPIYRQKGTDAGIINAVRFFMGIEIAIIVPAFAGVWRIGVDELGIGSTLGTSSSRARYSFAIIAPIELSAEQRKRIAGIANYMRDGRTHLIEIVEPSPAPIEPNHLELGLSELGVNWFLHQAITP